MSEIVEKNISDFFAKIAKARDKLEEEQGKNLLFTLDGMFQFSGALSIMVRAKDTNRYVMVRSTVDQSNDWAYSLEKIGGRVDWDSEGPFDSEPPTAVDLHTFAQRQAS